MSSLLLTRNNSKSPGRFDSSAREPQAPMRFLTNRAAAGHTNSTACKGEHCLPDTFSTNSSRSSNSPLSFHEHEEKRVRAYTVWTDSFLKPIKCDVLERQHCGFCTFLLPFTPRQFLHALSLQAETESKFQHSLSVADFGQMTKPPWNSIFPPTGWG